MSEIGDDLSRDASYAFGGGVRAVRRCNRKCGFLNIMEGTFVPLQRLSKMEQSASGFVQELRLNAKLALLFPYLPALTYPVTFFFTPVYNKRTLLYSLLLVCHFITTLPADADSPRLVHL